MLWRNLLFQLLLNSPDKELDDVDFYLKKNKNFVIELSELRETSQEFNITEYFFEKLMLEKIFDEVLDNIVVENDDIVLMTLNEGLARYNKELITFLTSVKSYSTDAVDLTQGRSYIDRKRWVEESLRRYHSFKAIHITQLAGLVTASASGKYLYMTQIRTMASRLELTVDRVYRILDSQVRKLEAHVSAAKSIDKGLFYALWWTKLDSKVRPSHRSLHGEMFDLRTGVPGIGLPGTPPYCRCVQKGATKWKIRV
jgi:SPP1 gp7 family putative phage head morphogenesis protein